MLTSAIEIIDRAYSLLGYKAAAEPLAGEDVQYALDILNGMIDDWNISPNLTTTETEIVHTTTDQTFTIGPVGQLVLDIAPPLLNDDCFVRYQGMDYPMQQLNYAEFQEIVLKSTESLIPRYFMYSREWGQGVVNLFPKPASSVELHLFIANDMPFFATAETELEFPQGYKRALQYNLAVELAPGITELPQAVAMQASLAKKKIKAQNLKVPLLNEGVDNYYGVSSFMLGR